MFIFNTSKKNHEKESFIDILRKVKSGKNNYLKNKFIADYKPFIIKSVSSNIGKYIEIENSEEYSVGLLAFNEAIEKYDESQNCSFKSFSQHVIKRRLIDYKRRNNNKLDVKPFTYFDNERDGKYVDNVVYLQRSNEDFKYNIRDEIKCFITELEIYGITLNDLLEKAPKHKDTRITCVKIAKILYNAKDLFEKLERKRVIPYSELKKLVGVSVKTLERNRKYIIAIVLILKSDLDVLKGYIKNVDL